MIYDGLTSDELQDFTDLPVEVLHQDAGSHTGKQH